MALDITTADVAYIVRLLDDLEPSEEVIRAVAAALVARKHGTPVQDQPEAVTVVRRVLAARQLPQD